MEIKDSGIDIGKALLKKKEDGHLYIWIYDNQELDVADIKAMVKAKNALFGDQPHTTIVIPGITSSITNEARTYASGKEAYQGAIAKSIVAKSLAIRLIGNFFIKFNKPPAPTKLFSNEKDAIRWLNQKRDLAEKLLHP